MIRIVVINVKGGCGKSTISTNLASLYASRGFQTALYDYDEQSSSMRWLEARPADCACDLWRHRASPCGQGGNP